jgi:hypothetical protein
MSFDNFNMIAFLFFFTYSINTSENLNLYNGRCWFIAEFSLLHNMTQTQNWQQCFVCVCVRACLRACVCACVYIYICMCVCIYI